MLTVKFCPTTPQQVCGSKQITAIEEIVFVGGLSIEHDITIIDKLNRKIDK